VDAWLASSLIAVLILLYGALAAARASFLTVSRSRLQDLAEEGSTRAKRALHLEAYPHDWIPAMLAARVLLLIGAAVMALYVCLDIVAPRVPPEYAPEAVAAFVAVAGLAPVALLFGEYLPRIIGSRRPEAVAIRSSPILDGLSLVLAPLCKPLWAITHVLMPSRGEGGPSEEQPSYLSEDEIRTLVEEGTEKGVFEPAEAELIENVFQFADSNVRSVMVPRAKMVGLPAASTSEEALKFMAENQFSRYPVYGENPGDVVGILHYKDFLGALGKGRPFVVRDLVRPPFFVPETMKVSHLLKEMQRRKLQMAVVVDEHGNVEGLVTMEDVIEEIVGEIRDETDVEEERRVERLKDGSYLIDASLPLRDLPEEIATTIPESDSYETLAGFLLDSLRVIPRGGEVVRHGGFKFTVVDMEGRRIARAKAEPLEAARPVETKKAE